MKFLFVSRKKYERALQTNKAINEERVKVTNQNYKMQEKILNLQKKVKELTSALAKEKENKNKIRKNRKNQKYFSQCKQCGKMFRITSLETKRVRCDKCIAREKRG